MSDDVLNVLFHGVGTPERELEPGEEGYWIDVDTFHRVLDDLAAASTSGALPRLRISFDDSNRSDLTIGLPALLERQLTADFFVLTGRLTLPGSLHAEDVRELLSHGMTIGTHGMRHHAWRQLSDAAIQEEFVIARDQLAEITGTAMNRAACPFGQYDRRTLSALRRLGYVEVFTSDRRYGRTGRWLQPRYTVHRGCTVASFRAHITASRAPHNRGRNYVATAVKTLR